MHEMASIDQTNTVSFIEETRNALQGVRRSLIELYASIDADPTSPQAVARKFGLNRNLTWKVSKVLNGSDAFATLNHLPGHQGLEMVIAAMHKAGAPIVAVEQARAAISQFVEAVDRHAGGREHLELTLESMGLFVREGGLESGREQAFRGNSMVWGVQARTRVGLGVVAPSRNSPDETDIVLVAGLVGFRRLRSSVAWRLFRSQIHDDKGRDINLPEELEAKLPGDQPQILREFCSPTMPPLEYRQTPEGREYVLPAGPVGNLAAFDCFYGYVSRNLPNRHGPNNECGSLAAAITLPVEQLVFDVIFHRDVKPAVDPEVLVYGFPHGGPDDPSQQSVRNLLPIALPLVELAGSPPAVATPLVPRYSQLVNTIYARMGWNPDDFVGFRVQMPFPPMMTRVVLRWPLV